GSKVTYYHPTFLYESLWNLVGFVLITVFYKKKKFDGQIVLSYLAWYGLGRMFIEGLRTDSLYIGEFRISQVVGFLCFVICTTLLIYMLVRKNREELDKEAYAPVYEKSRRTLLRTSEKEQAVKETEAAIDAIIAHAEEEKENNENGKTD
ncbi:MAG: prolipoprotein diacylglyceryl transferase, partial [Clostridia bacterium]|nr:prolipoprotein diacylglyceryl transferase [Clostridia bacterium]